MNKPASKRLGEIVLRTSNKEDMVAFYKNVVGLETYAEIGTSYFFKISDDLPGHPQLLAIFKENVPSNGPGEPGFSKTNKNNSTLHHFTFTLKSDDFKKEKKRVQNLVPEMRTSSHTGQNWKSFYVYDPEGNTVEFVAVSK